MAVRHHAAHIQVLDADGMEPPGEVGRELVQGIRADVGDTGMEPCASLALALARLLEPFCLRDRLRDSLRKRSSNALWGLGPVMVSPVESVASAETPKSTPTAPWFSALRLGGSSVSTVTLPNQRSATRETVADRIFPVKRNDSRIRTQPKLGMRMR